MVFKKEFFCCNKNIIACFLMLISPIFADRPGYYPPWGKDSELINYEKDKEIKKSENLLGQAAEKVILFHQNVISPVDGPRSHFRPTSARYMLLSMRRYGFFMGYLKGCDRLLRENKDAWVYRTIVIDDTIYKWDPTFN
jgi:putative component of membrane protein insertase Oxa1/YidC/SpoIIIJ protein YidD